MATKGLMGAKTLEANWDLGSKSWGTFITTCTFTPIVVGGEVGVGDWYYDCI